MSDTPPKRLDQRKDNPLHSPPQRHHADPAAPKSMIRNLGPTGPTPMAAPDAGTSHVGVPIAVSDDHGNAVKAAIATSEQSKDSHPSMGTP